MVSETIIVYNVCTLLKRVIINFKDIAYGRYF